MARTPARWVSFRCPPQLVTANRILGHEEILDAYGHVSIRDPAAEAVTGSTRRQLDAIAGAPGTACLDLAICEAGQHLRLPDRHDPSVHRDPPPPLEAPQDGIDALP